MNKVTAPGWPDPSEWINSLYQAMAERQKVYEAETDILLRRNKSAAMLGLLISHLMELPAFKNDTVHLPLKDLLIFLSDLDIGRDHPWSSPVNFGGTNIANTAQRELKIWVRAAFGVLKQNGYKPVQAYRRIASGLTKSGRSGRGGKPVRWQLVQAWCRENESKRDHLIREKVERWWSDFRQQTGNLNSVDGSGKLVLERELAGTFADLCWSLPHLRDQSFSA